MVIRPLPASQATCWPDEPELDELSTRFPPHPVATSPTTSAPARIELRVRTMGLLVGYNGAPAGHQVHDDRYGRAADPDADRDRLQVEQQQRGGHAEQALGPAGR